jgi:hypothetical protein
VIVLASVAGWAALWLPKSTFGAGGLDYVIAFLWGFGLNEAGVKFLTSAASTGVLPPEGG